MKLILRMGLVAAVVAAQCGVAQTVKVGTFDRPIDRGGVLSLSDVVGGGARERKTEMQQAKVAERPKEGRRTE